MTYWHTHTHNSHGEEWAFACEDCHLGGTLTHTDTDTDTQTYQQINTPTHTQTNTHTH